MNKSMLAVLNTSERLLVAETDASVLAVLDEDAEALARGVRTGRKPAAAPAGRTARKASTVTDAPIGDRALRSAASERERAGTKAATARRQAERDSR